MECYPNIPISEESCLWINDAMAWLVNTFGFDVLKQKPCIAADQEYIGIQYNADIQSVQNMGKLVAGQMDVASKLINVFLYSEGQRSIGGNEDTNQYGYICNRPKTKIIVVENILEKTRTAPTI